MALHRDIYWIGRQWAVTGFGIQAIDQRLQGAFDIESSHVWNDGLQARIGGHAWVNREDFDKALMVARQRFREPAGKSLPLVESVPQLIQQPAPAPSQQPMAPSRGDEADSHFVKRDVSAEQSPLPPLQLRVRGQLARFLPQWRVRR